MVGGEGVGFSAVLRNPSECFKSGVASPWRLDAPVNGHGSRVHQGAGACVADSVHWSVGDHSDVDASRTPGLPRQALSLLADPT